MCKVLMGLLAVALALTGCRTKSEEGGTAGTDTFKLAVPATPMVVTQGELQTVRVTVERGKGFKQPVKLEVTAPEGIGVEPQHTTVAPGDQGDLQLQLTAAEDAPIGEHRIRVRGTPETGEPTETEFKLTVNAK